VPSLGISWVSPILIPYLDTLKITQLKGQDQKRGGESGAQLGSILWIFLMCCNVQNYFL
jgi:hypothetical protein